MRFGANYDTKYTEAFETTQTGRDKAIQATLSYKIGSRRALSHRPMHVLLMEESCVSER